MIGFLRLKHRNKSIVLVSVLILLGIGLFYNWYTTPVPLSVMELPVRNATIPEVSMEAVYPQKIVYTTKIPAPKEDFIGDCSMRGGVFNSCGNGCAPDAEMCMTVCAYTCTLPE